MTTTYAARHLIQDLLKCNLDDPVVLKGTLTCGPITIIATWPAAKSVSAPKELKQSALSPKAQVFIPADYVPLPLPKETDEQRKTTRVARFGKIPLPTTKESMDEQRKFARVARFGKNPLPETKETLDAHRKDARRVRFGPPVDCNPAGSIYDHLNRILEADGIDTLKIGNLGAFVEKNKLLIRQTTTETEPLYAALCLHLSNRVCSIVLTRKTTHNKVAVQHLLRQTTPITKGVIQLPQKVGSVMNAMTALHTLLVKAGLDTDRFPCVKRFVETYPHFEWKELTDEFYTAAYHHFAGKDRVLAPMDEAGQPLLDPRKSVHYWLTESTSTPPLHRRCSAFKCCEA
ncbi:Hypothetical protein POVN_LOCUS162 [uncultured virus]|nr:Hypothetical protein POVN_LOCUS162 [uncultured virus]